jgi:hypothetical protein
LNVFNLIVVGVLVRVNPLIPVTIPFHFIVVAVFSPIDIQAIILRFIVDVRETTFPSLSKTFFNDALEHLHFSCDFLNLSPEEFDLTDFLPKRILVRLSERAQFIQ